MADSIVANLDILADSDCQVLRNGKVVRLMENEKDVLTSMIRVNRTNDFPASKQDVYNILHFLQDETPLTEFLDKAYHLGQARYLMGIHYKVAKLLVTNVNEYARILQSNIVPARRILHWKPLLHILCQKQLYTRKINRHISQLDSLQGIWRILQMMNKKYKNTFKTCQPHLQLIMITHSCQ